jgi:RNA polymerase sigma factor (sigma-70 family)
MLDAPRNERDTIETRIDLEAAVGRLPDRLRVVWRLYKHGYNQDEIGGKVGITQQAVNLRLESAINILKNL